MRGQNNVQGAGDMGALPNLPAGHLNMSPQDAVEAVLSDNNTVRLTSLYGVVRLPLELETGM